MRIINNFGAKKEKKNGSHDQEKWHTWFDSEKPEIANTFPNINKFHGIDSSYFLLLLLRTMRPDRLPAGLASYVAQNLGREYIEPKPFNIQEIFAESSPASPILCMWISSKLIFLHSLLSTFFFLFSFPSL